VATVCVFGCCVYVRVPFCVVKCEGACDVLSDFSVRVSFMCFPCAVWIND
jgi:hypothetical protein